MGPMTQGQRELAEANRGLAWMVANRFHRKVQGEDARQELGAIALLALCQAAQGFDEHRGYTFATYACRACWLAIRDERRNGGLIPTPRYLTRRDGIGHRNQAHRDHIREAKFSAEPLGMCLASAASPLEQAEADEVRERVRKLPGKLRYAMERSIEGWTNAEISREMGYSKQYVYDLIQIARARLRARGLKT